MLNMIERITRPIRRKLDRLQWERVSREAMARRKAANDSPWREIYIHQESPTVH